MEGSDAPKARRPLPTPGVGNGTQQRPSTPVQAAAQRPISPSQFYGTSKPPLPTRPKNPGSTHTTQQRPSTPVQAAAQRPISPSQFYGTSKPPLPTRPKNPGSTHTAYVAPAVSDPPRYGSPSSAPPGYREPELIVEEPEVEDDTLPDLIPGNDYDWNKSTTNTAASAYGNGWGTEQPPGEAWSEISSWNQSWDQTGSATGGLYSMDQFNTRRDNEVAIDGRSELEESRWWNEDERVRNGRPGTGMLAPVVAENMHDPLHSLFSVNIAAIPPAPATAPLPTSSFPASTPTPSESPSSSQAAANHVFPTEEEVRAAVPHPNAYYCPKDNGWVLLIWKSSSVAPPVTSSFADSLPNQDRRKRIQSCVSDAEQSSTSPNKTHHFHRYIKAVDSLKLTTPYREDPWRVEDVMKQKRRGQTVVEDVHKLKDGLDEKVEQEPEGKLLDLYVCCQCQLYCVVSEVIPGVVPRKHLEEFVRDKRNNPAPGKSGEVSVSTGMETLLLAIENKIFKGNHRLIKIQSTGFKTKLGWSPNIKRIFEYLGFVENTANNDATLMSPNTEIALNRKKLLRAWIELNAWLVDYRKQNSSAFRDPIYSEKKVWVQIDNAREMYQRGIGAHPDQIQRGVLTPTALTSLRNLDDAWRGLGLTPTTFSADLLAFAYLAQCRCDPAKTPRYFTWFCDIVKALETSGESSAQLQELMAMEQSRNRFTEMDIHLAAQNLGFGPEGHLRVDYDDDVDEDFVENAWKDAVKRAYRDPVNGSEMQRTADESLRILAEARGSNRLRQLWENKKNSMSPERAYDTLEVPADVDDAMLIMVFNMRCEESTSQMDKMREALTVIAEVRDSERLRQFLLTNQDPGDITLPTRPDFPRGLNQLGNTCYLNSLLQYFYTIKELRDAVMPMSTLDIKAIEEEKFSEEDINKHRVGGRRVSRREIIRSRKFIHQLANLFFYMQSSSDSAVTPSLDLAKLALVTSRDEEEEDEAEKVNADNSDVAEKNSVLGKRSRELDANRQGSVMDVDAQDVDGFVMVASPRKGGSPSPMEQDTPPQAGSPSKDKDGDVSMKPVPARKRADTYDGGMMFGRQHDVAECMDNCMFQIETALLKFGSKTEADSSIIKRLFFGKIRQRLTSANLTSRASLHEKEDLFSHLPVNVTNDGVDIYDGLSGYFDDVVEYQGGKARMEVSLVDVPLLLQIQLQRVQFNRETLQPYKSQAYVKFGETIYLDRFMDSADPRKKLRSRTIQRELNSCRERIQVLLEGKNGSFASALDRASGYLGSLQQTVPGIEDHLVSELQREKRHVEMEIDNLRVRVDQLKEELETLWGNSKEFPYELTSVFIHRGSSPSFGHYFFYSRHLPQEPDSWFKYNDSDVSVVSKDEVLQDTTGSTANPYLLVFARKGSNVVETVNRFDPTQLLS
ncbi:ubiquitin C-terminal hydrolase Ubp2 [Coprinopsis cinerea AmutBmut pab1-1]|nr:ubiquitin C-terminal hydrolase Ubp2 [Coprinopsis cinerea AmutBmut pab1-1]